MFIRGISLLARGLRTGDRRQLVLPVATTIFAGRDGQSSRPPANSCAGHRLCRYTVRANSIDTPSDSRKSHYVNPPSRGFSRMPKERRSRRPCRFAANAAWLAVQVMAHNLARWTARIGLGEQVVTTKTLRRRFFSIAGRLSRSARRAASLCIFPNAGPGKSS